MPTLIQKSALPCLAALALSACSAAPPTPVVTPTPAPTSGVLSGTERARQDSTRHPYTKADIDFMTGMIAHHAQAIVMSHMAGTHGASSAVQILAARIINAQNDEIRTMQSWLRDRNQPVPTPDTITGAMPAMTGTSGMPGMSGMADSAMAAPHHVMLMPGMLTADQMAHLDAARGDDFDRLFLTGMIQHHKGAVQMVSQLFATPGAGQDDLVFKFASDVNVDQTTEIARMQKMLSSLLFSGSTP
jgi:Uncharacterized protein conserved in bacteria